MRLIDADALIKQLSNYELQESPWGFYGNLKTYEAIKGCIDAIKEAPTVDAVEVVRCKECKYRETCEKIIWFDIGKYKAIGSEIDFCSYGERRTE